MGRRKAHRIKVREDRLKKLDKTRMAVAVWLLAKGTVEDRTQRSQPSPPVKDAEDPRGTDDGETLDPAKGRP